MESGGIAYWAHAGVFGVFSVLCWDYLDPRNSMNTHRELSPLFSPPFPDHHCLSRTAPCENFQEHPQSLILTDSIGPVLQQRHPDGQYCIGQDCGIYWREAEPPEKALKPPPCRTYLPSSTVDSSLLRAVAGIHRSDCSGVC